MHRSLRIARLEEQILWRDALDPLQREPFAVVELLTALRNLPRVLEGSKLATKAS